MRLSELSNHQIATITHVHQEHVPAKQQRETQCNSDPISARLASLGFVVGEKVEIITRGLFGGEPILVKVGLSRFALRHNEAARIEIDC